MRLLFTGRGGNGSWEVRGNQLGAACGARVQLMASRADCGEADIIVAVKRIPPLLLDAIRKSGRKWVLDVVDFYPQPACAAWDQEASIAWAKQQIKALNPSAVIWPTVRMMDDCSDGRPALVLPHHHRQGIARNKIREKVATIGYEGRAAYLGGWVPMLERECRRRGWRFVTNPQHLADLDIAIAVRGGEWDNYASRHWKSNVKLANAHGSGTPFVGNAEWGYMETACGGEFWVDDANHLREAFDRLTPKSAREAISSRFLRRAYPVASAAADLSGFLASL